MTDPEIPEGILAAAFEAAPIGMALLDLTGRWFRVNHALADMLGIPAEELLHVAPPVLRRADDPSAVTDPTAELTLDQRYRHRDGHVVWIRRRTSLVQDAAGLPEYLVATYEDIGARGDEDARLVQLALHDPLTGLANRALLDDRLAQAIAQRDRDGGMVVVLFCDVDGLKAINDRHGHAFGDRVLIAVAQRLVGQVRSGDTVARFGGDEFVVVCNLRAGADAESMSARLTGAVERAAPLIAPDGAEVPVRVSVGQQIGSDGRLDPAHLLGDADRSMYAAKRRRDRN